MAQLPPDGAFLIQQIDGAVVLFHQYTQEELLRFNPGDANEAAQAQKRIHDLPQLTAEQKCFAHFWSGYLYAHASGA
jgi:hypothetical protein